MVTVLLGCDIKNAVFFTRFKGVKSLVMIKVRLGKKS